MKNILKEMVKKIIPLALIEILFGLQQIMMKEASAMRRNKSVNHVRNYMLNLDQNQQDAEILEIIKFLEKSNPYFMYAHQFIREYNPLDVDVLTDETCNMNYVLHNNKKLYFPRTFDTESCRRDYNILRIEQDARSPHRYDTPEYAVKMGDVIADIGSAEGIWALTHAEVAEKIYLFECNKEYIAALQKTFEPYNHKVVIVNKYVSDVSKKKNITFDDFINGKKINVVKADIEGAEQAFLRGCTKTLASNERIKLLLCTYHTNNVPEGIKSILEKNGFITEFSNGYVLFPKKPYLRKGVIRASKESRVFT